MDSLASILVMKHTLLKEKQLEKRESDILGAHGDDALIACPQCTKAQAEDHLRKHGIRVKIWKGPDNRFELEFLPTGPSANEKTSLCVPIGEYKDFGAVTEDRVVWTKVMSWSMKIKTALTISIME